MSASDSHSAQPEKDERSKRRNEKDPRTPPRRKAPRRMHEQQVYRDRFIPSRSGSNFDLVGLAEFDDTKASDVSGSSPSSPSNNGPNTSSGSTYNMLLQSELLGIDLSPKSTVASVIENSPGASRNKNRLRHSPVLAYHNRNQRRATDEHDKHCLLSPLGSMSRKLMSRPVKAKRKISKVPFKVLDAPALQDDFYLNLVDWSASNVLAVGLGGCVYLWSAYTSKVTKLCDLGHDDLITSVSWSRRGNFVALGTNRGETQVWDPTEQKKIRTMSGHAGRVGTMAWNANLLATGSRDHYIYLRDPRADQDFIRKLSGHKQEVCGLRWSFDDKQLASGGNDNKLLIWDVNDSSPRVKFNKHTAAVKAIAWSPHQHGLLASGGGTADRKIRFWNTLTGSALSFVDTDSQVCNLIWSKNVNEIVSTHGYSLNQIIVWRYPQMSKVATLTGHTYRVLYLAMSPDGQTIVTGAGDETLRFWNVFPGPKNKDGARIGPGMLFPVGLDIR